MSTADKKNAYRIHSRISDSIFKEFMKHRGPMLHPVERLGQPVLSHLANKAARAIMNDPRLDVVLKKKG